ncbi:hypothetical protein Tco_1109991 [Tanacetum coccineum]|uniref:Uncharacterized protein n=1 Tax=Tanacetum coccineum TaxID=301880 RepID=A0ABQ5IK03_9ASTR
MLQSPPVRRALSSRLRLQHLKKVRVQRKDSDISSGIGLHVPRHAPFPRASVPLLGGQQDPADDAPHAPIAPCKVPRRSLYLSWGCHINLSSFLSSVLLLVIVVPLLVFPLSFYKLSPILNALCLKPLVQSVLEPMLIAIMQVAGLRSTFP